MSEQAPGATPEQSRPAAPRVRRRRWYAAGALLVAGGALGYIAFGDLGENLVYFWTPAELVAAGDRAVGTTVRLGGQVELGSLDWDHAAGRLKFRVTDGQKSVAVVATGSPPQMFREAIGVVVEGSCDRAGVFHADRLMVKHDNEYRPPAQGERPQDLYKTLIEDGT